MAPLFKLKTFAMKKKSLFLVIIFAALAVCSCNKKRTLQEVADDAILKPEMELSQSDTTEVLSLVNRYIQLQKDGKAEDAFSMIYFLDKDSIVPLPAEMKKRLYGYYSLIDFKGKEAQIDHLIFVDETDSQVRYTVELFKQKPGEAQRPTKMSFFINPVRRDGKWYLTLPDDVTDTRPGGSQIKN